MPFLSIESDPMEEHGYIGFQRCYTCGRWHPVDGAYSGRFCSRECARAYRRCPVCGDYFEAESGAEGQFCSAECAGVDARDRAEDLAELPQETTSVDPIDDGRE